MLCVGLILVDIIFPDGIVGLRPLQEPACFVHDVLRVGWGPA